MSNKKSGSQRNRSTQPKQGGRPTASRPGGGRPAGGQPQPKGAQPRGRRSPGPGRPQGTPAPRRGGQRPAQGKWTQARQQQPRDYDRGGPADTGLAYTERGREDHSNAYASKRFGPGARPAPRPQYRPAPLPISRQGERQEQEPENLLSGRNPIREALKAKRDIEKLLIASGDLSGSAREIVSMARKAGVLIQEVDRSRLDQITRNHQGMVAFASAFAYSTVDDMLALAKEKKQPPFLILLDKLTDPQNLGAIIRTAACVGAHGVVVPVHRAVGLTPAAVRASAGAVEHVKVARVVNLNQLIKNLKRQRIWVYGADAKGKDLRQVDFDGPCALVIGSEGEGISEHTLSLCDHRVAIPMTGVIDSLNASVAAGVLMYAAYMGRKT